MVSAYQVLIFVPFLEINGHPAPIRKYVHVSKISEIVNKIVFM
jgi:hypothetical protein